VAGVDLSVHLIEYAHVSLGRTRQALSWLHEVRIPGPSTHVSRTMSDQARAQLDRTVRAERAERLIRAGTTGALAPSPAPVRLGITVLEARNYQSLRELCARLADEAGVRYTGRAGVTQGTAMALWWLGKTGLDSIRSEDTAEHAVAVLDSIDRVAREASGASDIVREHLDTPCPACQRRGLYADRTSTQRREWYVICETSTVIDGVVHRCRCTGLGCPCLRGYRQEHGRHVWTVSEWGGTLGALAALSDQPEPAAA